MSTLTFLCLTFFSLLAMFLANKNDLGKKNDSNPFICAFYVTVIAQNGFQNEYFMLLKVMT